MSITYSPISVWDRFWLWSLWLTADEDCCVTTHSGSVKKERAGGDCPFSGHSQEGPSEQWPCSLVRSYLAFLVNGQRCDTHLVCQKIYGSCRTLARRLASPMTDMTTCLSIHWRLPKNPSGLSIRLLFIVLFALVSFLSSILVLIFWALFLCTKTY